MNLKKFIFNRTVNLNREIACKCQKARIVCSNAGGWSLSQPEAVKSPFKILSSKPSSRRLIFNFYVKVKNFLLAPRLSKMNFFLVLWNFFSSIMISKMGVKMNFRIITKNHATDTKVRSPRKKRFLSRLNSRVPPDSLEVKLI